MGVTLHYTKVAARVRAMVATQTEVPTMQPHHTELWARAYLKL